MGDDSGRLTDLFQRKNDVLSFEIFPPGTTRGMETLFDHLERLRVFQPDYISVTYGAGGSTHDRSLEIVEKLCRDFPAEVVAHFTCVGTDREGILSFVHRLEKAGVKNILALRGDPPRGDPEFDFSRGCFRYAVELVRFLKQHSCFCIAVAGFPEGHLEAPSREQDWDHLKAKIDAGAEAVITQLFFDNADYFRFRDGMAKRGVKVPLVPGVLPVASLERLEKIVNLSGSKISAEFQDLADRTRHDPEAFRAASLEYSMRQVLDLKAGGAPGIHYYILNQSEMIADLLARI